MTSAPRLAMFSAALMSAFSVFLKFSFSGLCAFGLQPLTQPEISSANIFDFGAGIKFTVGSRSNFGNSANNHLGRKFKFFTNLIVVGALKNGFAKNFVFKGKFADEIIKID